VRDVALARREFVAEPTVEDDARAFMARVSDHLDAIRREMERADEAEREINLHLVLAGHVPPSRECECCGNPLTAEQVQERDDDWRADCLGMDRAVYTATLGRGYVEILRQRRANALALFEEARQWVPAAPLPQGYGRARR
jgi:hypothetical protein